MPGEDVRNTQPNREKAAALQAALARLIKQACTRGIHGQFSLIFKSTDGSIVNQIHEIVDLTTKVGGEPGTGETASD
jgi:hypothetical protein